jgi:ketosteroid isomerase-like protein
MQRLAFVLLALATLTAVYTPVPAQTKTEPRLDRLAAEFQAAYNSGDAEKVASFYAEDAVSMPPNRPMGQGQAARIATLRRNLAEDPATMMVTPIESAIVGDHGYEVGTRVMTWKTGLVLKEKYVRLYKRVGSDWKIAYFIWNSDSSAGPPR